MCVQDTLLTGTYEVPSGLIVTQKLRGRNNWTYCSSITWPQKKRAYCNTNHVAAMKTGLLFHKSRGRNKLNYCSPKTWAQNKRASCYSNNVAAKQTGLFLHTNYVAATTGLIVPQSEEEALLLHKSRCRNKRNYCSPTTWPKKAGLLFSINAAKNKRVYGYTNHVGAKQEGLLLHKLRVHKKRTYSSPVTWTQNKRSYCYTNYVAVTNEFIATQLLYRKISGLTVTESS